MYNVVFLSQAMKLYFNVFSLSIKCLLQAYISISSAVPKAIQSDPSVHGTSQHLKRYLAHIYPKTDSRDHVLLKSAS